jgi:hypothetical protein
MATKKQAAARAKFAKAAQAKGNTKVGRRAKSTAAAKKKRQVVAFTLIACVATAVVFFTLGWILSPTKVVAPEQLAAYMNRVVNREGHDMRRMQMRRMLYRADRRTMRLDGGQPAVVHRMRKRNDIPTRLVAERPRR